MMAGLLQMTFGGVIFASAFLLFQVQLVLAKQILPWFGGTSSVWTVAQMFFQATLLVGYIYAHVLGSGRDVRRQARIHVAMLAVATAVVFAPLLFSAAPLLAPDSLKPVGVDNPTMRLLTILTASVGFPFFALATTAPLLQHWHGLWSSSSTAKTYSLYALSNAGSLLGLLSYPFGIEPLLGIREQAWMWAFLFLGFAGACGWIGHRVGRLARPAEVNGVANDQRLPTDDEATSWTARAGWIVLPFVTSVLFLATTNELTLDVAAIPFLWMLPLAIYLLTFIICFDRPQWSTRRWPLVTAVVSTLVVLPTVAPGLPVGVQVTAYSVFLFAVCLLCHGELVRLRPGRRGLTAFYVAIAVGGLLGGVFVGIAAPMVFPDLWEFRLAILAAWLAVGLAWLRDRSSPLHSGDPWVALLAVTLSVALLSRYVMERTGVGRIPLIAAYGWHIAGVAAMLTAAAFRLLAWQSRIPSARLWPQIVFSALLLSSGYLAWQRITYDDDKVLHESRNFYGVVRVTSQKAERTELRQMLHGTTVHGAEYMQGSTPSPATAYYSPSSGISLAARILARQRGRSSGDAGIHMGIVGMGIGTMSAFAQPNDRVRYYELNPDVITVAVGSDAASPYFSFVSRSTAEETTVLGDARLALERELARGHPQQFDLLVLDAFASDSIPLHLITSEAFRLYSAHLNDYSSILAVNVTNRYLDIEPVVAAHANMLGYHGMRFDSAGDPPVVSRSSWILLARQRAAFSHPAALAFSGRALRTRQVAFTDSFSNLFRVMK
jgi:hypothetical protein